jgi:D-glycero-alpha-D-manno-heptose-7-phosphate kinase
MGFDGVQRYSSAASSQICKAIQGDSSNKNLIQLAEISNAGIKAFGSEADITEHACLTKESRNIKLHMNGDYSNLRTNELIEATERAGSLCTRIMGAGGGGFFICWAPPHKHESIKQSVRVNSWVDVRFSKTGSQIIFSE